MSTDYLQEKDLVYRVFGVIQEEPQKQDQYAELLAKYYSHSPEPFVAQFSNCIYTVLIAKGPNRDIGKLIQFSAVVASRCTGNEQVPILSPLIIEVQLDIKDYDVGPPFLYKNKRSDSSHAVSTGCQRNLGSFKGTGSRGESDSKTEASVYGKKSRQSDCCPNCSSYWLVSSSESIEPRR